MFFLRSTLLSLAAATTLAAYTIGAPVLVQRDSPLFPYGKTDVSGTSGVGSNSFTAQSGIFGLRYVEANPKTTSPYGDPKPGFNYKDFEAICIDANEALFSGTQLYYVETIAHYTTLASSSASNPVSLSAATKMKLGQLFTVAWNDVRKGVYTATERALRSAAFQWAAWNIARDPDMTLGTNVAGSGGPVRITGATYNSGGTPTNDKARVQQRANTYLSWITPNTAVTQLLVWSPVKAIRNTDGSFSYKRVSGQELLTPAPEPAFFGVLALGLAAVVYRRRKVSQTA